MTISELVRQRGANLCIFDMGRRIQSLDAGLFDDIEQQKRPYPSPYLKHAWLGLLSWHPNEPGQHAIWFLKLPLDEQGLLDAQARDGFVRYIAQRMASPEADKGEGEAPFSFKPDGNRMAFFHALAGRQLGAENSRFYDTTRAYLAGDIGWENWQQLGLQGLAEVVANHDKDNNEALLARAIPYLPTVPLNVVLGFMENIAAAQDVTTAVNDRLAAVIKAGATANDLAAFARALSHSQNLEQRHLLLAAILRHPQAVQVEVLAAISSRCWADLSGDLLLDFLEVLASNAGGDDVFNALVADMMSLPGMRDRMMSVFTSGKQSSKLDQAVTRLLGAVRGQMQ
ncbi:DUF3549 family protein [Oceanobacter kriegii]|uniref:DUF3549 family protein n=1 Tax=Oceanobacter kriegii TaxID=64972 RepID=UPI00146C1080|nr:DUF3549 family protein [Oceanobacter kriegii]